jgi:hypothetical protein
MESTVRFLIEQYYDVQKLRVEAFNHIVAFVKSQRMAEIHMIGASHIKNETHFQVASHVDVENQEKNAVKPSILAKQIIALKVEVPKDIADLVWYHNSLYETEKAIAKRLNGWSKHHKLRLNYLNSVTGIGPILASGLIAWLSPISRFDNISKLWKYCGLAPDSKRRKGEKLHYNPRLKTLMWKIASSFEKQKAEKSGYRRIYEEKKKYYLQREDLAEAIKNGEKGAKLHVRLMTMRVTVKRFLADLWVVWRKMEGLSVTEPYSIAILKHSGYEEPTLNKSCNI